MELIIVVALLVALAFWQRSNFLMIVGGMAAIGFGIYWAVSAAGFAYLVTGVASVCIGIYMLITAALDMFRR